MEEAFAEGALKTGVRRKASQPLPVLDVGKHRVYIFIKEGMVPFGGNSGNT